MRRIHRGVPALLNPKRTVEPYWPTAVLVYPYAAKMGDGLYRDYSYGRLWHEVLMMATRSLLRSAALCALRPAPVRPS
jgi:hypothetical protein